ncbi:MAG: FtsW/RodA/SpoVE family cell cycle protein [Clostridia bacterium]|nr:FtsW/RodA/SpoVE family cell cycle protein [Clostridia bacterium]
MTRETTRIKAPYRVDVLTIILVSTLVLFGLVTLVNVFCDPFDGSEVSFQDYLDKMHLAFPSRQVGNIAISLLLAVPLAIFDYELYKPFSKTAYLVCLVLLLLLVLIGENTRGAFGWYTIGTRAFQPSELTKVVLIIILSKTAAERYERHGALSRPLDVLICMLYVLVPFVLVLLQRDFGTAMVLLVIAIAILFAVRLHWAYLAIGAGGMAAAAVIGWQFFFTEVQKNRIRVFLDPTRDLKGDGLNVLHAKQVIGSGGLFGKGYFVKGTLIQTGYVPVWHSDFIFAGIGEGLGFIGCTVLILAFFVLFFHWLRTALRARDIYGRCLVVGCTAMLASHVFENIGMCMGAMPVTGIPLPFISYGGSNILASLACVGIVMSVYARAGGRRRL